jgi:acyl-coenzyme A synthetase/AMP-(fatty) acid ligase
MLVVGQNADSCCWLPGARFNIAECALSSPDPDRPAIVWADEATPHVLHSLSYGQLATHSAHVAAALRSMGLEQGMHYSSLAI